MNIIFVVIITMAIVSIISNEYYYRKRNTELYKSIEELKKYIEKELNK